MQKNQRIGVVIPALNEREAIGLVIRDIPSFVDEVVVVDNGSTDGTPDAAAAAGATVLHEPTRGYGWACTKGIRHLAQSGTDIIVFLDGDYSDYPEELPAIVQPLLDGTHDFVLGSRVMGDREQGALLPQALFGNQLAGFLIRLFWGYSFTDLGPFRALRATTLDAMKLREMRYGWTVEMQIKAAKMKLRCIEVPARYRNRIGQSKVTGTFSGTVKASYRILFVIFRSLFTAR